jgi:hypothetical protein
MAGHSRTKDGVASLACDPAIQLLRKKMDARVKPGHDGCEILASERHRRTLQRLTPFHSFRRGANCIRLLLMIVLPGKRRACVIAPVVWSARGAPSFSFPHRREGAERRKGATS